MEEERIEIKLTEKGTVIAFMGDLSKLMLHWVTEFERLKESYERDGYEIIDENMEQGYFVAKK